MARAVSIKNEEQDRLLDELLKGKTPDQILGDVGTVRGAIRILPIFGFC